MTEKYVLSVQELAQQMGISLPKAYELVKEPEFQDIFPAHRVHWRCRFSAADKRHNEVRHWADTQ